MIALHRGSNITRVKLTLIFCTAILFVGFCDPLLLWSRDAQEQRQGGETKTQAWRPNKPSANGQYLGAQACAECHKDKVMSYKPTAMSRALENVADCQILRDHPVLTYKLGPYSYKITRQGDQSIYSVTDGTSTISEPILHCFGQGKAGQTYLLKHRDAVYESRLSFYNDTQGLDITIGYPRTTPNSLEEAVGRLTPPDEVRSCYGCHSTAAVSGTQLHIDKLMPGVSCEACHGPGEKHVAAMKSGKYEEIFMLNPTKLGPDTLTQELCASCHRSAEDVSFMPDRAGINNVRFQPYRLFNSACYADDRRISCTACHNPHQNLKQDISFYDTKCLACHTTNSKEKTALLIKTASLAEQKSAAAVPRPTAPPCPVETKNCASCHMPKIELPGSHRSFTDHRIRIVKAGEPFPK